MDIQDIYSKYNQWLKDLDFLNLERRFLKKIVRDYIAGSGLVNKKVVESVEERLIQLGLDIHSLRSDVITNQTRIELIIRDEIDKNRSEIKDNELILERRHEELFTSFHKLKLELFELSSQIMEEETMD